MKQLVCALDGCKTRFAPSRKNQIYCSTAHGRSAANRRQRGSYSGFNPAAADNVLERRAIAARATAEASKRAENAARSELVVTQAELAAVQAELAEYQRKGEATPHWLLPKRRVGREHRGTLVAFLSDTHFGEVVDVDEMNGYNKYDLDIAEKRLKRFFERTILVARQYLAGVKYDGIVLVHGGDIVSGDIHDELSETNALSTLQTCRWAIPKIRSGVEMLAEEFGRVHNVSVPGNHGRNSRKPRHKRRADNNADTHIAHLLADQMAGTEGVSWHVPSSIDASFEVYGRLFSVEHGDQAKGGDGQVGALGPAKRLALRKATQTHEEGRAFDYLLLGHFHQLIFGQTQGFVMNGSLKGYDEYARAWHFRPERAQQALMVVTPENGITMSAPIIVQNRESEGW